MARSTVAQGGRDRSCGIQRRIVFSGRFPRGPADHRRTLMSSTVASADNSNIAVLTYNAPSEMLIGSVGKHHFHMKAYSGGGRGSVHPNKWDHSINSSFANTKEKGSQRGGTLPSGHYLCHYKAHHSKFHECIWLERCSDATAINSPFSTHAIPHFRGNDFFIHGRGELGSDGCIVPENKWLRLSLNQAIKQFPGKVYVHVVGTAYLLPAERGGGMLA
jgi:hypothetical protein